MDGKFESPFTREAAWQLVLDYTDSPSLRKHALSVETCVRAYGVREADARSLVGSERDSLIEKYAITGVLHDFDYERFPSLDDHPFAGNKILAELGWPEEIRTAILSHASYSGVPRNSHLEKSLFACDELAGFLTACSLVKPTKSIFDVDVAGVRKKMKDKAFARGVHREDILNGAAELGVDLDQHIAFCLEAMQKNADELGLAGVQPS
ncbi:metal dependent phosphohydrolase [Acidisarcina polymorpha]|uniref:Metal dependent phosphohydrolase n=1 Tax=Acidisarcina polymorpha TaxID=2211140 RepID=A0A2Z5FSK4_9BACT|nr:HAD family hydrolase [Acidisarcina polymorpha]AXC09818.1 metal dependent phosphohydrolase [Acidisarcina polymorpha]